MPHHVRIVSRYRRSIAAAVLCTTLGWTSYTPAEGLLGGIVSIGAGPGGASVSIGGGGGGTVSVGLGSEAGSGNVISAPSLASVDISGGGAGNSSSGGAGGPLGGNSGGTVSLGLGSEAGSGNVISAPNLASVNISGGGPGGGVSVGGPVGGVSVGLGSGAHPGNVLAVPNIVGVDIYRGGSTRNGPGAPWNNGSVQNNSTANIFLANRNYAGQPAQPSGPSVPLSSLSNNMRMLITIIQARAWLAYMNGRSVCLPQAGVAQLGGWVANSEVQKLPQILAPYAQEISSLRRMLNNCPALKRAIGSAQLNRAIAVDVRNGRPVLWLL